MIRILTGTALLLVVLALFILFSYKTPPRYEGNGCITGKSPACASFLVEAFHFSLFGRNKSGIKFLENVGAANGSIRWSCCRYFSF